MKKNLSHRVAANANIQFMAHSSSSSATQLKRVPSVSPEQLEEIRRPWASAEKKDDASEHNSLNATLLFRSFVTGFGNLLNIFPSRRRREVYIPSATAEEQIKDAWTEVGRVLCEVTRSYDSTKK